jgi:GR25 family glycosyltransferase involved in LPS biosynthesis
LDTVASNVFVLNLAHDRSRLEYQMAQAERFGFDFVLYPAVLGSALEPAAVSPEIVDPSTTLRLLELNPGGLGHGLSFIELLGYAARLPDGQSVWIVEDDAAIMPWAVSELPRAVNQLPEKWDVLTLGFQMWEQRGVLFGWNLDWVGEQYSENLVIPPGGMQTTSWMLSSTGARKILERVLPWRDPYDYVLYGESLRARGFYDDYPTPGSFDLMMQLYFQEWSVFHGISGGRRLIAEAEQFPSSICAQGRKIGYESSVAHRDV